MSPAPPRSDADFNTRQDPAQARSEFINHNLLAWGEQRQNTVTRSRPGYSNDGAHRRTEELAVVRRGGDHGYDTAAELLLLNKIWVLQSQITNFFLHQQKLISKVRDGAKVTKTYDVR